MNDDEFDELLRIKGPSLRWEPGDADVDAFRKAVRARLSDEETVTFYLSGWLVPAAAVLLLIIGASGLAFTAIEDEVTFWDEGVATLVEEDYYRAIQ